MLQRTAGQHLHDEVGRAIALEEVVRQQDARRAIQRGKRATLGQEALAPSR